MIKLHYLGTGAAEGFPSVFCNCDACRKVRQRLGKEVKTRSCTLLGEDTLIDLSPDLFTQAVRDRLELSRVKRIFFTHSHADHLDLPGLMYRLKEGASHLLVPEEENRIDCWGPEGVWQRILKGYAEQKDADPSRLRFHLLHAFASVDVPGYRVTAIRANHMQTEECLNFIIDDGTKAVLYANDTGRLPDESIAFLLSYGKPFSLLSLDCARGTLQGDGHMGLAEIKELVGILRAAGRIDGGTRILLNHYSHMCGLAPGEFDEIVKPLGMSLTFDGQIVEV